MKIVDSKGKLFGKISVIDLLVILLVIAVAEVVVVKVTSTPASGEIETSGTKLTDAGRVTEVDPAAYETVTRYVYRSAGLKDQLMASGDMMNGYVVDCVATPHITYVEQPDGTVAAVESTGDDPRLDLLFTIEVYVTDTVRNTVGTQEVRTGKKHVVKTSHFEFEEGVILSCVWDEAD